MNGEIVKYSNGEWIIKFVYMASDKQIIKHELPVHPFYKNYQFTIGENVKFQYAKECENHFPETCDCLNHTLYALPIMQKPKKFDKWLFWLTLITFLLLLSQAFSQGVSIQSGVGATHMDVAYLKECNVQTLRIQIKPVDRAKKYNITPQLAFNIELAWALRIVDECNKEGIKPVIAFNDLTNSDAVTDEMPIFWNDTTYLNKAYYYIDKIGQKFANKIYAYEFLAEPAIKLADTVVTPPRLQEFYQTALNIIRVRDTNAYFMLTPGPYGMPTNYGKFVPYNINDSKLMYNFHMYLPFSYTHQGLNDRPKGVVYPLANFNADTILKRFNAVKKFSDKYGYPIFLGEFSAVRWAKNSGDYIQDVINAADQCGFEWCYFAYKPNFRFWNPFYGIANTNALPVNYYLKNYGIDSQTWMLIIYNLQNGKSSVLPTF